MKFKDKGAIFQIFGDKSVITFIYINTNYILKNEPTSRRRVLNKSGKYKMVKHKPNELFSIILDKDGRDFVSTKDLSKKEYHVLNEKQNVIQEYDYADYTPKEMFDILKQIDKVYTKKWVNLRYKIINDAMSKLK